MPNPETYTVEEIESVFKRHAGRDDWNVKYFYLDGLIAALRGEYDCETVAFGMRCNRDRGHEGDHSLLLPAVDASDSVGDFRG